MPALRARRPPLPPAHLYTGDQAYTSGPLAGQRARACSGQRRKERRSAAAPAGAMASQIFCPTRFVWRFGGQQVRPCRTLMARASHERALLARQPRGLAPAGPRSAEGAAATPAALPLRPLPAAAAAAAAAQLTFGRAGPHLAPALVRPCRCTCAAPSRDGWKRCPCRRWTASPARLRWWCTCRPGASAGPRLACCAVAGALSLLQRGLQQLGGCSLPHGDSCSWPNPAWCAVLQAATWRTAGVPSIASRPRARTPCCARHRPPARRQVPPVQVHCGRRVAARREPALHARPAGQRQQLALCAQARGPGGAGGTRVRRPRQGTAVRAEALPQPRRGRCGDKGCGCGRQAAVQCAAASRACAARNPLARSHVAGGLHQSLQQAAHAQHPAAMGGGLGAAASMQHQQPVAHGETVPSSRSQSGGWQVGGREAGR